MRENNIKVVIYVYDILLMSEETCVTDHCDFVIHTLSDLGFIINWEKSDIEPEHSKVFIGFVIDSIGDRKCPWIRIPLKKVQKLKKDIRRSLKQQQITARALARIAGSCVAVARAILPGKIITSQCVQLVKDSLVPGWILSLWINIVLMT